MSDTATAAAIEDKSQTGSGLKPAAQLAAKSAKPYPNDSSEYRKARTALLVEEIELRRQIERVAEQRRSPRSELLCAARPRRAPPAWPSRNVDRPRRIDGDRGGNIGLAPPKLKRR